MRSFNLLKRGHGLQSGTQDPEDKPEERVDSPSSSASPGESKPRVKRLVVLTVILLAVGSWLYFTSKQPTSPGKGPSPMRIQKPGAQPQPVDKAPGALLEAAQRIPEKAKPAEKAKPTESIERIPIEPLPPQKPSEAAPAIPAPSSPIKETPAPKPSKTPTVEKTEPKTGIRTEKAITPPAPASQAATRKKKGSARLKSSAAGIYQVEVASCLSDDCLQKAQSQIKRSGYKSQQTKVGRKAEMYLVVGGEFTSALLAQRRQRQIDGQGIKTTIRPIEDGKQAVVAGIFEDLPGARSQRSSLKEQSGPWRIIRRSIEVETTIVFVSGFKTYEQAVKAKARLSAQGLHPEIRMVKK
ncbi:MAG TPA: hypothetical protein VJM80_11260 [bacterium]|nr:hypothetical protein [bacterium]